MPTGLINAPPKTECEWASRHYGNETAVQAGGDRPHCYCCFVSTSNFMWLRPADTPGNAAAVLPPPAGVLRPQKEARQNSNKRTGSGAAEPRAVQRSLPRTTRRLRRVVSRCEGGIGQNTPARPKVHKTTWERMKP